MLSLPQTAQYALRAVSYIAEHEASGPVPVSTVAAALDAPQNYLSKTLHQLGTVGVLRSERGVRGGYRLGRPAADLRLAEVVEPFLTPTEQRCIMGHAHCSDAEPCGGHWRWMAVRETARHFFVDLTLADLLEGRGKAGRAIPTGHPRGAAEAGTRSTGPGTRHSGPRP